MTFTTTIDLTHAVQVVTDARRARLGFRAECSCGWASGWTDQVGAESAGVEHREIAVGPGDGLDRLMGELLDTQDDLATVVVWLAENWSADLPVPTLHGTGAAHTGPVKLELWAFCSDPDDVVRIGHLLGVPSIDDETPGHHGSRYRRVVRRFGRVSVEALAVVERGSAR